MRIATEIDVDAIAPCLLDLSRFVGASSSDPYANGLASLSLDDACEFVSATISKDDGFAFVEELKGSVVGCIVGSVEHTSFLPSGIGHVGKIEALWVHCGHRGRGIGSRLVAEAERQFRESRRSVEFVELSYLAGNELASNVWERLGYKAFRVFSFKQLPEVQSQYNG